jgi:hypothetical protein
VTPGWRIPGVWRARLGLLLYSSHHVGFAGFGGGAAGASISRAAGAVGALMAASLVTYRVLSVDFQVDGEDVVIRNRYRTQRCGRSEILGLSSTSVNRLLNFAPPAIILELGGEDQAARSIRVDASAAVGRPLRSEILERFTTLARTSPGLRRYRDYAGGRA